MPYALCSVFILNCLGHDTSMPTVQLFKDVACYFIRLLRTTVTFVTNSVPLRQTCTRGLVCARPGCSLLCHTDGHIVLGVILASDTGNLVVDLLSSQLLLQPISSIYLRYLHYRYLFGKPLTGHYSEWLCRLF